MGSQRGFTLIEIIVSLTLVSVLAAAAGFGLVEVARSYRFAKENATMAQKAHIALQRISLELMALSSVTTANNTNIAVKTANGTRSVEFNDTQVWLNDNANALNGEILIDNVTGFELTYYDSNNSAWNDTMDDDQLFGIAVSLTLSRNDGVMVPPFTTQITPRNNGNFNAPQ